MSTLVEDMTRLRGELNALAGARTVFRENLRDTMSGMRSGFRKAQAAMAKQTKADCLGFVSDLEDTVSGMRSGFRKAQAAMAKQTKAERSEFVSDLGDTVSGMRSGFCRAHAAMAKQTKAEGLEFVSALKQGVGDARREFCANLKAAREAWLGQSAARSTTRTQTEASKGEGGPRPKRKGGRRKQG